MPVAQAIGLGIIATEEDSVSLYLHERLCWGDFGHRMYLVDFTPELVAALPQAGPPRKFWQCQCNLSWDPVLLEVAPS
jgi:hypothetical protein